MFGMKHRLSFALCLLVVATSSPARADVIITNYPGTGDQQAIQLHSTSWGALGINVGSQAYTLDSVKLRMDYTSEAPTLQLRADNGNFAPGNVVLANFSTPASSGAGSADYVFLPTLSPDPAPVLAANTRYWFVLFGNDPLSGISPLWRSFASPNDDPTGSGATIQEYMTSVNAGSTWAGVTSSVLHPGVEISGTPYSAVPEPTSFLLVAGLAAAGGLRRRLRRK